MTEMEIDGGSGGFGRDENVRGNSERPEYS